MDIVERGEMVEKELDLLIERRSENGEVDPDEQEELWKESVRRYNSERLEEHRSLWLAHHIRMAAIHEDLARAQTERGDAGPEGG